MNPVDQPTAKSATVSSAPSATVSSSALSTIIRFGPGGNSQSFQETRLPSEAAPAWLRRQGLSAYEYQCGRGVKLPKQKGQLIGAAAREQDIYLSIHAPYYINLSSEETERIEKNIGYVLQTAKAAAWLGARRMVVHCGGQGHLTRERAIRNTLANIKRILQALDDAHYTSCAVCLETMGKQSVLGSAEEVCQFVASDDRLLPCIDFGHLNARTGGGMNTREAVAALFDLLEQTIGQERTRCFHGHFSHIEYNDKGEVRHLTFADTVYGPDFLPVAQELAARNYTPILICESAGTQTEDALQMQACYQQEKERLTASGEPPA